jgi:methyltransferase (TIGR00027 family)
MEPTAPSRTAMMAAIGRGQHRLRDPSPWVFDDPFALLLVGPAWPQIYAGITAVVREAVVREAIGFMVGRSRYAEDRLAAGRFTQYVILGAGLDSFAWRRPDVLRRLRVFEVDHPATQAWKQERLAVLALPSSERHTFTPVDFETETLPEGLDATGFDWAQRTLFSWLGVTPYLTVDAIEATLRTVASCAPGSEIVMTYTPSRPFLDDIGCEFQDTAGRLTADAGEPLLTFLSPSEAEAVIEGCRLKVAEHPANDELYDRYFAARPDDLRPYTFERVLVAVAPQRD